jgi:hypothetical protein
MDTKVSKRNYCLQIQYFSTFLYLCSNLSCNKASNPWRTRPSYSTTKNSYVIHISEDGKKKISFIFNVFSKNISTLCNNNKAIQRGSTFQSNVPRFAKERCFSEGSQASPVCASVKINMFKTIGGGMILTGELPFQWTFCPLKLQMDWPRIKTGPPQWQGGRPTKLLAHDTDFVKAKRVWIKYKI